MDKKSVHIVNPLIFQVIIELSLCFNKYLRQYKIININAHIFSQINKNIIINLPVINY